MKLSRWIITITATVVVVGSCWFGAKQYRCQKRNATFARQIESIKQDAYQQLKIGAKKADVARFFNEHKISFDIVPSPAKEGGFEAIGTLYTIGGCAPFGCGTDRALIGVRVKVDPEGVVMGDLEVVDMYTDCL